MYYSGDSYFSAQLTPVNFQRTARYGYGFGCVCRVLAQRAEVVVWEGKLLSEAEMRCFLFVSFSATVFNMCRNSKPSRCSVWG